MSGAPSMPLFLDAYLADTTHLSTEEHGAYLLLLMAMWRRNGAVPDDDKDLARIVGLSRGKWRATKARLLPFLSVENGEITQKRLRKEWEYVKEKRDKNAENGAKGGRPKANENKGVAKANGSVSDNPDKSEPTPIPNPSKKEEPSGSSKKRGTRLPDDWEPDIDFALSVGLSRSEAESEATTFREWWPAQPGQKGVKLDWDLTWKTWCRRAVERKRPAPRGQSPPQRERTVSDVLGEIASGTYSPPTGQADEPDYPTIETGF